MENNKDSNYDVAFRLSRNLGFLSIGCGAFLIAFSNQAERLTTVQELAPVLGGTIAASLIGMAASKVGKLFESDSQESRPKLKM